MAKVRVYQLAKELNVQSALILELLDRMGQEVKSDLSTLDGGTAELVKKRVLTALDAEKKRLEKERRAAEAAAAADAADAPAPAAVPEPAAPGPAEPIPAAKPAEAPAPVAARAEPKPTAKPPAGKPKAAKPAAATAKRPEPPKPPLPPGARKPRVFAAKRTVPLTTVRFPKKEPARPGGRPGGPHYAPPGSGPYARRPGGGPAGARRRKKAKKKPAEVERATHIPSAKPRADLPPVPESITLSEAVTVKELAEKLNRKSKDVIAKLITRGVLATINQPLDPDVAIDVALEFGSIANVMSFEEEAQKAAEASPAAPAAAEAEQLEQELDVPAGEAVERPPVVTVMGHVDHGKTSLLDAIRKANVVDREHGGITQHIGAYQVVEGGRKITFLDTPGHEAFTLMRARGAKATDIVVLVVAADDGVKPQTVEAIDHAKAAGSPIVVAINKIDKPGASADRVKQQLTEHELVVEDFGGDIVSCEVSAKQGTGLDTLLEMILLVSEVQELRAHPAKPATGIVLEAKLDKARGVVATVLVQDGTLNVGDPFIVGSTYGKVRAMTDENGKRVSSVGPSTPVEIIGLDDEPSAGDTLQAVSDESRARQIASFRYEKERAAAMQRSSRRSLLDLSREIAEGEIQELPLLLKTDVQGSIEALQKAIGDLPSDKIRVNVLRTSTGAITQADVLLAVASNAIIVGFNVRPDRSAAELAAKEDVEIRVYSVIYDVLNDLKQAMLGMLAPTLHEQVLGQAEVRELFKVPKVGIVAGCYVSDGKVTRNAEVRLLRDNVVVYTGKVGSLKRFKEDVGEVKQGYECGIGIENYNDVKLGDVIEFFEIQQVAAKSL